MTGNTKKGIIFAVLAAAISGASIFYNKLVVVGGIDSLIFNILKNGGVAIALSVFLIASGKVRILSTLTKRQWIYLAAIGIIGGSIPFVLFFDALKTVSAVNANLIQKTLFIWVALLAIPFLHEKLSAWQVVGYILVAWSNVLLGGLGGFKFSTAEFMILAATLLWSVENVIAKITLKNTDSFVVAWGRMFIGSFILLVIAAIQGKIGLLASVTPTQLWMTAGSIILLTGYVTSWYRALKFAPATLVTSVLILATPITNILSAIFISHTLPNEQIMQTVVMVAGLAVIAKFANKSTNTPLPA